MTLKGNSTGKWISHKLGLGLVSGVVKVFSIREVKTVNSPLIAVLGSRINHTHTHTLEAQWAHTLEAQVRIPSRGMGTFFAHTVSSIFRLLRHTHKKKPESAKTQALGTTRRQRNSHQWLLTTVATDFFAGDCFCRDCSAWIARNDCVDEAGADLEEEGIERGPCILRHAIQISTEAIKACHPALSTEWLAGWTAISRILWCMCTGPFGHSISHTQGRVQINK